MLIRSAFILFVARCVVAQNCQFFQNDTARYVSHFNTDSWIGDIAFSDSLAFLPAQWTGVLICNFSDPLNPLLVNSFATPGAARAVTIENNTAYVSCGNDGVALFDITDPDSCQLLSRILADPYSASTTVVSSTLFVSNVYSISAYDVTNPSAPTLQWELEMAVDAILMTAIDNLLYVANGASGITVVDCDAHSVLTRLPIPGFTRTIAMGDGFAYVGASGGGVYMIDVHDPRNPTLLNGFHWIGNGYCVLLYARSLYILGDEHCFAFDVLDPYNPVYLGLTERTLVRWVAPYQDYLILADSDIGLLITQRQCNPIVLEITCSGNDVLLTWNDPTSTSWRVLSTSNPGESPDTWEILARTQEPFHSDGNALMNGSRFYRIESDSDNSGD